LATCAPLKTVRIDQDLGLRSGRFESLVHANRGCRPGTDGQGPEGMAGRDLLAPIPLPSRFVALRSSVFQRDRLGPVHDGQGYFTFLR
jgi:hypothetical protein